MSFTVISLDPVGPKAGTGGPPAPAGAPAGGGQPASGGGLVSMLPLLMFIPLLFILFRRQKKEQEQRSKLKKGDKVVSSAGLIGELMEMDERVAKVKIAPGTTVLMTLASISPYEPEPPKKDAAKDSSKDDPAKDSKADGKASDKK